jgi:hypothetical protein
MSWHIIHHQRLHDQRFQLCMIGRLILPYASFPLTLTNKKDRLLESYTF